MTSVPWQNNQTLTVEQAIRKGAAYLENFELAYAHGTDNAMDEAAWLVLEAAGQSPVEKPDYRRKLSADERSRALKFLQRRALQREPAAYITGRTWFAGLEFLSDERALVPRSPLAEPLMQGFSRFISPGGVRRVLDLCTGGGCIAIACAYAFSHARIDAVDISAEALALAECNIEKHAMQKRVELIQGDLFEGIEAAQQYDLIISNPPYVDQQDMSALSDEFKKEPRLGLAAGRDGLDIVRRILLQAADYLAPAGLLVCEVGNSAPALEAAFPELRFEWLEFARGGDGVFLLGRDDLAK